MKRIKLMTHLDFILLLFLVSFIAFGSTGWAATYYVSTTGSDANPGSPTQPWRTIQFAANTIVGGDTAIVQAGTYAERVTTANGGSAGNRIIFKANSNVVLNGGFNINHSYITIDGFELLVGTGNGFSVSEGGNYCEIINNDMHSFSNGSGRAVDIARTNTNPQGCLIKSNHVHSEGTAATSPNLYMMIAGRNHIIENNEFGPGLIYEDNFRVWGTGHIFRNNYTHDVQGDGRGGHVDYVQSFEVSGVPVSNILFEKNYVNGWPGQTWIFDGTTGSGNITFRNNIFVSVQGAGNSYLPNTKVYSNVFDNVGYGNGWAIFITNDPVRCPACTGANSAIKDNIFYNTGTGGNNGWYTSNPASSGSLPTDLDANYNMMYPNKAGFSEPNGINGLNPLFVDPSIKNFHLRQNSPAIDRGTNLSLEGFNDDKDNVTRPIGSAWDIGAYEFITGDTLSPSPPTNLRVN